MICKVIEENTMPIDPDNKKPENEFLAKFFVRIHDQCRGCTADEIISLALLKWKVLKEYMVAKSLYYLEVHPSSKTNDLQMSMFDKDKYGKELFEAISPGLKESLFIPAIMDLIDVFFTELMIRNRS